VTVQPLMPPEAAQAGVFRHPVLRGRLVEAVVLGPAVGGCRMWPYATEADAITDVLRLSQGMTYKAALAELPYGGGKTVIIGDPRTGKSAALFRALGIYLPLITTNCAILALAIFQTNRAYTLLEALAFALGSSTAGVGGSILSVLYPFFPASHYDWISRLLGIIVLGGMGSLPGALVGALVLGLAETLTATYGSLRWATLVFYLVILAVLLFRPQGLYGTRLREDVTA